MHVKLRALEVTYSQRRTHAANEYVVSVGVKARIAVSRKWTEDELRIIESIPRRWPRTPKLTPDQVKAIRLRVDSLTQSWTLAGLAEEFKVSKRTIAKIARRQDWPDRAFEPDGKPWWREVEDG